MTDNKQPQFDVMPTDNSYRRLDRRRSCLCTTRFQIIVTLLVIFGCVILIFWLIFFPTNLKFHVTDASLTDFTFEDNTLRYNLGIKVTVRNPNKHVGISYEKIKAWAHYEDRSFSAVTLNAIHQAHKNTSIWSLVFQGQNLVVLNASSVNFSNYLNSAKSIKDYTNVIVILKINVKLKLSYGKLRTLSRACNIGCALKVPFNGNGFNTTKCNRRGR